MITQSFTIIMKDSCWWLICLYVKLDLLQIAALWNGKELVIYIYIVTYWTYDFNFLWVLAEIIHRSIRENYRKDSKQWNNLLKVSHLEFQQIIVYFIFSPYVFPPPFFFSFHFLTPTSFLTYPIPNSLDFWVKYVCKCYFMSSSASFPIWQAVVLSNSSRNKPSHGLNNCRKKE